MAIAHPHNLNETPPVSRPYGIKASLRGRDPFVRVGGAGWQKFHWYASERERDAAFDDMAGRHLYSRRGDEPSVVYEKVAQPA